MIPYKLSSKKLWQIGKNLPKFFHQPSRLSRRYSYAKLFICQNSDCGIRQSFYRQVFLPYGIRIITHKNHSS